MSDPQFDQLLLDLYACPGENSRWHEVLDQVCRAMRARSALVQLLAAGSDRLYTQWIVGDSEAAASEHVRSPSFGDEENPRLQLSRRRPLKTHILRDSDLFAPGEAALMVLRERSASFGLGRFLSVGIPLPDEGRLALVLHRDVDDHTDFDASEVSFAQRLLPHVQQTVQLTQRLDAAHRRSQDLADAVNRLSCAFALCTPDARVLWANEAARQIFSRRERLWLAAERVTTASPRETAALRQMISEAALEPTKEVPPGKYVTVLGRHSGLQALQVMLQPCAGHSGGVSGASRSVLLILAEPGRPHSLPAEIVETVFDLSPAESRLAAALCGGMHLNDYASACGVAVETVRYQLKQILAKTQTHRQSDLVRQICSSVVAQALLHAR